MTANAGTAPHKPLPRFAVFISGGGRTLLNIHDHIERGTLRAEIALVVASAECTGAARARERGLSVEIHAGHLTPESLDAILATTNPDWIVLAGYIKKLPILPRYRGRVVNIHPALLPKFGGHGLHGMRVHKAVLDAHETISGCTVHLADDDYDTGPIILQKTCPVLSGDTPESLAARVFECEREAYPQALAKLIDT